MSAKSFFSTLIQGVEGFAVEVFKGVLSSSEGKQLETSIENFIKTDVGVLAVDAVDYASTLPAGTSDADKRAAAKTKLVADLKAAGKDVETIGESGIELFISMAYTGATSKIASLALLLAKIQAQPAAK